VTFRLRGRAGLLRQHALGAVVFFLTLGLTTGALGVLHGLAVHPPRGLELAVLIVASTAATVTRHVALRTWVFARRRDRTPTTPAGRPKEPEPVDHHRHALRLIRGGIAVEDWRRGADTSVEWVFLLIGTRRPAQSGSDCC